MDTSRMNPSNVGIDAYLRSPIYCCIANLREDRRIELYDLLGPHANREMNLMAMGLKPCALIEKVRGNFLMAVWEARGYFVHSCYPMHGDIIYLVCQPDQAWRAYAIERVYSHCRQHGRMTRWDHARLGILLGYPKSAIRAFINRSCR